MIRKDTALDADRPHYYSQFWIDVAAGKRDGGGARPAVAEPEDMLAAGLEEHIEPEPIPLVPEIPVEKPPSRPTRPKPEPKKPEPARPALTSLADLAKIDLMMKNSAEMDTEAVPDLEAAAGLAPELDEAIVTDFYPEAVGVENQAEEQPAAELEEEYADDEFEEEDEWGGDEPRRGSKPSKRQRREPRRDF